MLNKLLLSLLAAVLLIPAYSPAAEEKLSHEEEITAYRERREARLRNPDGWLTLVGLHWLEPGDNSVGSADGNDIVLTGGPDYWGSVLLEDDQLLFVNSDTARVSINGESLKQSLLIADKDGEPTIVSAETIHFYTIYRGSYGLRIKDSQAIALQEFKGVENYSIQQDWRINGRFTRADEGTSIEITNVLGQINDMPVFGTIEFDRDGSSHSLLGLGDTDSESLWFIFADRTSGHGTYGAGRFLYSDGMPENGHLTVDFNKAYNPPCAFNPYSTCPLPPQRNRMDLMVPAGEKDFHPASG